jgi:hypothetical protein
MAHLGERGFDTIGGAVVSTTAFVFKNSHHASLKGDYLRLVDGVNEADKAARMKEAIRDPHCSWHYRASAADFEKIPGSPIAYWASENVYRAFKDLVRLGDIGSPKIGMRTGDNERFLRMWFEVSTADFRHPESSKLYEKWTPYNKGGEFRRWYGNLDFVVNWKDDGHEIKEATLAAYPQLDWDNLGWKISNEGYYFQKGVTWTDLSSSSFGVRLLPKGLIFDAAGPAIFGDHPEIILAQLGSKPSFEFLKLLNPTLHFKNYNIAALPYPEISNKEAVAGRVTRLVQVSKSDWDSFETSWDFTTLPLLLPEHRAGTLEATYARLRTHWQGMTDEMKRLEEENNRIFIDAYSLQEELTPEVPIEEITLTCNPAYRYGVKGTEEDRETRLLADTMAEFLSYAVGCMFGRYSPNAPGLILANQGETLADYLARVPEPSFLPDKDNVIPVLDADWFPDDIVDRFRRFLRVTFGEAHFRENLAFIEAQMGDIRKYFTKSFYDDHVKRYKKRPIYWMFSSPRGTFQALVYMHRYRPDTVSVLLNDYLREFIRKLEAERGRLEKLSDDPAATQTQRTRALKDVAIVIKQIAELEEWEREVIFPLAQAKIEIDLDDGVKRNYPRFGAALKPIKGLEETDE